MKNTALLPCLILLGLIPEALLTAQTGANREIPLENWPTPLYWQPSAPESSTRFLMPEIRGNEPKAATPAGSLVFVPMAPCRIVDTRTGQGFSGFFGPPGLNVYPSAIRNFPVQSSPQCPVPGSAQAYSLNVTIVPNPIGTPVGYLTLYPTAAAPNTPPTFVTLDDVTGDIRNNAAIVPAGISNGSISAVTNGSNSPDLIIDINGYYAPSTGLTLANSTAAAPSVSFSGDPTTGIFSLASGVLEFASGGTTELTMYSKGDVEMTGNLRKNGSLFLHNRGYLNTGAGLNALATQGGGANTALGQGALLQNTSGFSNSSIGGASLIFNTIGFQNTVVGFDANQQGSLDAAVVGTGAGYFGDGNAIIGYASFDQITANYSIGIGFNAGINARNGNNIEIFNFAASETEANTIRIGNTSLENSFFAAGIAGVTVSNPAGVLINTSTAQLGTASSSRRYKEDIENMGETSAGLFKLRPVSFRYRQPYPDGSRPLDYGLIAEEVGEVYPDLVARNANGEAETVEYQKLPAMLVNEVQKQHQRIRRNHELIQSLQEQAAALQAVIDRLAGKLRGDTGR